MFPHDQENSRFSLHTLQPAQGKSSGTAFLISACSILCNSSLDKYISIPPALHYILYIVCPILQIQHHRRKVPVPLPIIKYLSLVSLLQCPNQHSFVFNTRHFATSCRKVTDTDSHGVFIK